MNKYAASLVFTKTELNGSLTISNRLVIKKANTEEEAFTMAYFEANKIYKNHQLAFHVTAEIYDVSLEAPLPREQGAMDVRPAYLRDTISGGYPK